MHKVIKIRFTLYFGEMPGADCFGYAELNGDGHKIGLYNGYGEEIDMFGAHEYVKVRSLGKFDNDDRDDFYSLLESDGVG
ncbi:MAG: hypothetical protein K0Q63_2070 [Paenibacillus sp.]|nr:hypothetical protein [Paenibacillus sp.]